MMDEPKAIQPKRKAFKVGDKKTSITLNVTGWTKVEDLINSPEFRNDIEDAFLTAFRNAMNK